MAQERETNASSEYGPRASGGLLDGISVSQVIAGAAAAATSVALASHIGWMGSIIGAAISSVVTVVTSQLYRRFLTASAEKLKRGRSSAGPRGGEGLGVDYPAEPPAAGGYRGARIAPVELREEAAAARRQTQRRVLLFSAGAAVLAVAACALAISLVTAGRGLGERIALGLSESGAPVLQTLSSPPGNSSPVAPAPGDESAPSDGQPDADATAEGAPTGGAGSSQPSGGATGDSTESANGSSENATGAGTTAGTGSESAGTDTSVEGSGQDGSTPQDEGSTGGDAAQNGSSQDAAASTDASGSSPSASGTTASQ